MKLLLAIACLVLSGASHAQDYPNRALRIIVPVGTGGGFDLLARVVAPPLSERLGQPVVVENRPGAGSLLGTELVAKAPHDGYTLLVGGVTNIAANVGLYKNLPYDPLADFRVLSISTTSGLCLLARRDLPAGSLKEVVDFARANPGKLSYASAGVGTAQHIIGALLAHLTGTQMLHVPYKGAGAAQTDMLAGRVDLFFNNCGVVKQFVDSGQFKLFAVTTRERSPAYPQVPTILETGVTKLDFDSWIGFFAGSRTPAPVVERLRAEIAAVLAQPAVAARLDRDGTSLVRMTPAQAESYVQSEVQRWRTLIPQVGIAAE